jgi:hypothetical protein
MNPQRFRHWTSAVPAGVKLRRFLNYPAKLRKVVGDPRVRAGTFFLNLQQLSGRYASAADLTRHEFRVFSQNGEDGIIAEVVRRVGQDFPRTFVEFGAGNGLTGNTLFLADVLGWRGLYIEAAKEDFGIIERKYRWTPHVTTLQSFVYPHNINQLVSRAGLTGDIGVFSIDVDGNDYYIWRALEVRPLLVIVEYNGAIPLDEPLVQPFSHEPWDGTDYYGASLEALTRLGASLGYTLLYTDLTGTNAFFVRQDIAPRFADVLPSPRRVVNHELLGLSHPHDRQGRRYCQPDPSEGIDSPSGGKA